MNEYTDEDIMKMKKITCKIAGKYLGISSMAVSIGLRNEKLPIGYAVQKSKDNWSYFIIKERLVAYKNGNLNEMIVNGIEDKLSKIIENFEEIRKDLILLVKSK